MVSSINRGDDPTLLLTSFFSSGFAGLLAFVSIRDRRFFKAHGFLPGAKPTVHPSC